MPGCFRGRGRGAQNWSRSSYKGSGRRLKWPESGNIGDANNVPELIYQHESAQLEVQEARRPGKPKPRNVAEALQGSGLRARPLDYGGPERL